MFLNRSACCDRAEVPVQCKITYVDVPIALVRPQNKRPREDVEGEGARGRVRAGRGRVCPKRRRKKGDVWKTIVYRKWPVFLPHHMAQALIKGQAAPTLMPLLRNCVSPVMLQYTCHAVVNCSASIPYLNASKAKGYGLAVLLEPCEM